MAGKVNPEIARRNIALTGEVMRYLLENPNVLQSLPERFELVILPEDDPEIRLYNLELLDQYGSEGKPIVFARMKSAPIASPPSIFVPLAA